MNVVAIPVAAIFIFQEIIKKLDKTPDDWPEWKLK